MSHATSLREAAATTPLLLLGSRADPASERGTICPGTVPAPEDPALVERARAARALLGDDAFVLGHHYQRDEVIQFADARGDSFKLARDAARNGAPFIMFCGVHFMAETADILTPPDVQVILPDLAAGCSMADMAEIGPRTPAPRCSGRSGRATRSCSCPTSTSAGTPRCSSTASGSATASSTTRGGPAAG
jgi:quinolinate synthase